MATEKADIVLTKKGDQLMVDIKAGGQRCKGVTTKLVEGLEKDFGVKMTIQNETDLIVALHEGDYTPQAFRSDALSQLGRT